MVVVVVVFLIYRKADIRVQGKGENHGGLRSSRVIFGEEVHLEESGGVRAGEQRALPADVMV